LKQDLLGAVLLLDYESCCTEKWLVSKCDTNHFFVGVELKSAIRRTMKELMCAPACGAIVWGFVIETAEIGSIASQFAVAYCI
jgi:hypothetical protein